MYIMQAQRGETICSSAAQVTLQGLSTREGPCEAHVNAAST